MLRLKEKNNKTNKQTQKKHTRYYWLGYTVHTRSKKKKQQTNIEEINQ